MYHTIIISKRLLPGDEHMPGLKRLLPGDEHMPGLKYVRN